MSGQIPEAWPLTPGHVSAPKVFAQTAPPGALVVAGRNYGHAFALPAQLRAQGIQFALRLCHNLILEPAGPGRPLTEAGRPAGVVRGRLARFGAHGDGPVFRAVRAEARGDVFQLAATREDLSAERIGLICRQRWEVELFFKWLKAILNCRHGLAASPAGGQIQIGCALIPSLLLMLWTGQRPNKRMAESLPWRWPGLAAEEDPLTLLQRAGCQKKARSF